MRTFVARSRANAEARFILRVSSGLRLCSLDRACGEEAADKTGIVALRQAVAAALRLPSRFPFASAHGRGGAYLQAAKVTRGTVARTNKRRGRYSYLKIDGIVA